MSSLDALKDQVYQAILGDQKTFAVSAHRAFADVWAIIEPIVGQAEMDRLRILDLAEWHDAKAEKARRFPALGMEALMSAKAHLHDDAARRIREIFQVDQGGCKFCLPGHECIDLCTGQEP